MTTFPFTLSNEIALVTGGGTGLGLAMARCLTAAGARVVITGRRPEPLADAAVAIGGGAVPIPWDVTKLDTLPRLLTRIELEVGPLAILINNAGVHLKKPALDTTDAEFQTVTQTHLGAAFALSREAARGMAARGHGSILFVGSMASLFGIPNVAAYTAAKAGVVGLTRALATEWSPQGVRVNAIVPGWIDSGMARAALEADPPRKQKILGRTPMQKLGEADDIGWATVYLCSPAAKFITGAALPIDGGASIGF